MDVLRQRDTTSHLYVLCPSRLHFAPHDSTYEASVLSEATFDRDLNDRRARRRSKGGERAYSGLTAAARGGKKTTGLTFRALALLLTDVCLHLQPPAGTELETELVKTRGDQFDDRRYSTEALRLWGGLWLVEMAKWLHNVHHNERKQHLSRNIFPSYLVCFKFSWFVAVHWAQGGPSGTMETQ